MSVTNEKTSIGKRDSSFPVSFKEFQRLIVNLQEIALQLKAANDGSKTLDHWTRWYYEEFYRNPSIREQYPFKVGPCPGRIRSKLLKMPEPAKTPDNIINASHSRPEASPLPQPESEAMVVESQLQPTPNVIVKSESDSSPDCDGVTVRVDKAGTFVFPVSFKIFEKNLNKMEVFKRIAKSQDYLKLAADDHYRMQLLRKFYNRFYMHPERRSSTNLFKEVPDILLARLLKSGRPHDAMAVKSMAEYAARKTLENKSIVTFVLFKENLSNLSDIVEQMKQKDNYYESKDFQECAFDFYLAFYITPEIREKYEYELRPGTSTMQARMLAVLSKKVAEELRQSLPQLANPSPALQLPVYKSPEKSTEKAKAGKENVARSEDAKKSAQVPEIISMEVAVELPQLAIPLAGLELSRSKTPESSPAKANNEDQFVDTISKKAVVELPQLDIPSAGLEQLRSKSPERSPAKAKNVNQVVEIISMVKLPQLAIPSAGLEQPRSKTPERSPAKANNVNQIAKSLPFETDVEVSIGKWGRFRFPVSYNTFRNYINYDEIIPIILKKHYARNEGVLKELIADTSNPQCGKIFRQSYNRFYVHNEKFRKKIPYKFNCTDSNMLNKFLESAKPLDEAATKTMCLFASEDKKDVPKAIEIQVTCPPEKPVEHRPPSVMEVCPNEPDCQDVCTTKNPCEGRRASPNNVIEKNEDVTENSGQIPPPVSLKTFKHHVSNLNEIATEMLLCPEYKEKSKEDVIREYYQGFYSGQEMRERFVCRFKPCPSKMLEKLLCFPPSNREVFPKEPDCQDVCTAEKPSEEIEDKPNSQAVFAVPRNVIPKRKERQITKNEKKATPIANQPLLENQCKTTLVASDVVTHPEINHFFPVEIMESHNEQTVVKPLHISEDCNAARMLELNCKPEIDAVELEAHNMFTYLFDGSTCPEMQDSLKIQFNHYRLAQKEPLHSDTNPDETATTASKENQPVPTSNPIEVDKISEDHDPIKLITASKENELEESSKQPVDELEQANRMEIQVETSNNRGTSPSSPKCASENISRDEGVSTKTDENPSVAPSSPRNTDDETLLGQAKDIFFAENDKDHNMRYMICTSQGLMRTIWRILYQLTLQEFCQYTSIHDAEALYKRDEDLQCCFRHVVGLGNWPINLYVRLGFLKQLLHSKGVQLDKLELSSISPKILSPWELGSYSDFDKIVEEEYTYHTGDIIDDVVQLCQEREKLYAACWTRNMWISRVPQIAEEVLNAEIGEVESSLDGISLRPICGVKSEYENSPTEVVSIASSSDTVCEETTCPPTQLNSSNFVDIECVDPASQVPQLADDPLTPEETVPETPPNDHLPTSSVLVTVKKEPISLPNNQRATLSSSENCQWEEITPQEQIIDLDASQNEGSSLSCFAITKPKEMAAGQKLNLILCENDSETDENFNMLEAPTSKELSANVAPTRDQSKLAQVQIPVVLGKRRSPSVELPSKRIKVVNEKVPQLRHEFQPLPIGIMVRVESGGNNRKDCQATATHQPEEKNILEKPPNLQNAPSPQPAEVTITPSQEFAAGNTLLECTQLQHLLDSTNVNTRQVNEEPTDTVLVEPRAPEPLGASPLQRTVVFRDLDRFCFVNRLTVQQIMKYRIERHLPGATYQDALVKIDERLCNVRGPLLSCLFPHLSSELRSDLEYVLRDLGEFWYKWNWPRHKDSTVDIRTRVLTVFVNLSPNFGQFRVQFDNESREWGTCSEVAKEEPDIVEQETSCNVAEFLSPRILSRIRELKQLID
ncbi:protein telomere ends associated isoform X2 [Drosophila subpulchrella]|uniref:protein telomere ends associated isoform X2 n=1 Tax=Drosophila subpulchrella TaxID=1486046 RepID=UPI0018A18719|nr:protein telomere ends associated isoform X2 [Drosophila subpulchrella]